MKGEHGHAREQWCRPLANLKKARCNRDDGKGPKMKQIAKQQFLERRQLPRSTSNPFKYMLRVMPVKLLAVPVLVAVLTATQAHSQLTYTPYTFTTLAGNWGHG